MKRETRFKVTHNEGTEYWWSFRRENAEWVVTDHTGYERYLGEKWCDAVKAIHIVIENHGCTSNLS